MDFNNYCWCFLGKIDGSGIATILITLLVALLAGLVALYQVKLNTISSARIRWIENLRLAISEYLTLVDSVMVIMQNTLYNADKDSNYMGSDKQEDQYADYMKRSNRVEEISYRIKLYLNIKEEPHKRIDQILDQIDALLEHGLKDTKNKRVIIRGFRNEIIGISRKIFKEEWDRSKKIF